MNSTTVNAILAQITDWEAQGIPEAQIKVWVEEILADLYED